MSQSQIAHWRMIFKPTWIDEDGELKQEDVWKKCCADGCARIWAADLRDLTDVAEQDFSAVWAEDYGGGNQVHQGSVRGFRYAMAVGDIIYAVGTPKGRMSGKSAIVAKGIIVGEYEYDDSDGAHFRALKWEPRFVPIPSHLVPETMKAPRHPIRPLGEEHLAEIEAAHKIALWPTIIAQTLCVLWMVIEL